MMFDLDRLKAERDGMRESGQPTPGLDARIEQLEASAAERARAEGWEWAIVEVFGHRRHAGRTREEEHFGAKMLRVDEPTVDELGRFISYRTIYYSGASLFSFTLTDEDNVRRINARRSPSALYHRPVEANAEEASADA